MITNSIKPEQVYVTELDFGMSEFRNDPQISVIAINLYGYCREFSIVVTWLER